MILFYRYLTATFQDGKPRRDGFYNPPPPSYSPLLLYPFHHWFRKQKKKGKKKKVSVVESEPTKCFIIRKQLIITVWSQTVSSLTQLPCVGWRPPAMHVCMLVCVFMSASLREVRLKLRWKADVQPHTAYTPAGGSVKITTIKEMRKNWTL